MFSARNNVTVAAVSPEIVELVERMTEEIIVEVLRAYSKTMAMDVDHQG